jgi:hypothetical protein
MTDYLGFPVLEEKPNADAAREIVRSRNIAVLDGETGVVDWDDRAGLPVNAHRGFNWLLDGRAEVDAFRAWLATQRGRLNPLWVPSWNRDLVLLAPVSSGEDEIEIEKIGYTQNLFPFPARQHLYIPGQSVAALGWGEAGWGSSPWGGAAAGSMFRRVIAAVENANSETLTLDAPLDADLAQDALICFLLFSRLLEDETEIEFLTSLVAQAATDFVELPKEAP